MNLVWYVTGFSYNIPCREVTLGSLTVLSRELVFVTCTRWQGEGRGAGGGGGAGSDVCHTLQLLATSP